MSASTTPPVHYRESAGCRPPEGGEDGLDCVKPRMGLPGSVGPRQVERCTAPTSVLAGKRGPLSPARKVPPRARRFRPPHRLLTGRYHTNALTKEREEGSHLLLKGVKIPFARKKGRQRGASLPAFFAREWDFYPFQEEMASFFPLLGQGVGVVPACQ